MSVNAKKTAIISQCGTYRYSLTRDWNEDLPRCAFIMINPSTADADTDDATIRKCIGFSSRLGFGGFSVGNIFAYRATDVKELRTADRPIGQDNGAALFSLMKCDTIFAAWGNSSKIPAKYKGQDGAVMEYFTKRGKTLHCLGKTKSGDPKHPLMLSYQTPVEVYASPPTPATPHGETI